MEPKQMRELDRGMNKEGILNMCDEVMPGMQPEQQTFTITQGESQLRNDPPNSDQLIVSRLMFHNMKLCTDYKL